MSEDTGKSKKVPKLRFPGFTDDWEQRRLGEVGRACSGVGFPDVEQGGKKGVPFYKVSDMNNDGNEHEMLRANNYVTDEQIARRGWRPIDDVPAIFFAKVGAAVLLNRKRLCRIPFLLDNNTMAYSMDKTVLDPEFSRNLFETIDLTSLVRVGALPSYNTGDVEKIKISIPQIEEQKRIAEFLAEVDHHITFQQRKLDHLKERKKALLQKMFPKEGTNVPELRFPGFTDAWEQRRLGEVFDFSVKTNSLSRAALSEDEGDIFNIHYGDILVKYNEVVDPIYDRVPKIRDGTTINLMEAVLKDGDVVFADAAEDLMVGKVVEVTNMTNNPTVAGLHTIVARPQIKFSDYYLGYYFNSHYFHKRIKYVAQGTKVFSISKHVLEQLMMEFPKKIEEQKAIVKLLDGLSRDITVQQRKLDHLKLRKKALLQQMFV